MAPLPRALSLATLSFSVLLLSCGGGSGASNTPITYTLTVSPQPASVAAGSTVTFTATTNAPSVTWGLVGIDVNTPPNFAGSPTSQSSGTTFTYTAPTTPPVSSSYIETAGTVTLRTIAGATDTVNTTFTITASSITTGFFTPVSTSVALGAMLVINAYAVGSTNNALTMQVNGTTGGSTSVGAIAPVTNGIYGEYTYTAPATMPMTGSTITITVVSQADPTKSSNLVLTLH
jgi:hypothetical protein